MVRRNRKSSRCQQHTMDNLADKTEPAAPLAEMESYEDDEYDDGVMRITVIIDDEDDVVDLQPSTPVPPQTGTSTRKHTSLLRRRSSKKSKAADSNTTTGTTTVANSRPAGESTALNDSDYKLSSNTKRQTAFDVNKISCVIDHLIDNIEQYGLSTEGVYRKSGAVHKVNKLTAKLHKAISQAKVITSIDLVAYSHDVHVLTSVLKSLLREMKEPLLTVELYPLFIQLVDNKDEEQRNNEINDLVLRLPIAHQELIDKLVIHFVRVSRQSSFNRMSIGALSVVFAPNFLPPYQLTDITLNLEKRVKCMQYVIEARMQVLKHQLSLSSDDDDNNHVMAVDARTRETDSSSSSVIDDTPTRVTQLQYTKEDPRTADESSGLNSMEETPPTASEESLTKLIMNSLSDSVNSFINMTDSN